MYLAGVWGVFGRFWEVFGRCMRCFERCLGAFRIWFGTSLRDVWEVKGCI